MENTRKLSSPFSHKWKAGTTRGIFTVLGQWGWFCQRDGLGEKQKASQIKGVAYLFICLEEKVTLPPTQSALSSPAEHSPLLWSLPPPPARGGALPATLSSHCMGQDAAWARMQQGPGSGLLYSSQPSFLNRLALHAANMSEV